jgi:nicotinate dehydrogenase subunit B
MHTESTPSITRRAFLSRSGALVITFSLLPEAIDAQTAGASTGSLARTPYLDAWLRIDADGAISVFTGKAELGQGIRTALVQIAAEELEVAPESIRLIAPDTSVTPNEGYTAGSRSMQDGGMAIRHAAAQAREILAAAAGQRLSNDLLHVRAQPTSKLKEPGTFRVMGTSMPRVDIPAKVTGGMAYVHDLRLPNMAHARVVRPPGPGAKLRGFDARAVESMPGVLKIVRDGDFLAVVAEGEFQAVQAMRKLASAARWEEKPSLPASSDLPAVLMKLPSEDATVLHQPATPTQTPSGRTLEATFTRPYQCHASIGPSCAVALFENGSMTVWTHTQGVFPDRAAIAEMLRLPPEKVRCIHMEGAGCYGHNGADDAAADAAIIARAIPGRPVGVQWMREQEHAWEPYGPAMVTKVRATLDDAGTIVAWNYDLWSNTHTMRPGPAGSLLAARHLATPFAPETPQVRISPDGTGDRNAVPLYTFANKHIVWHFLRDMPLRVSALRALGAYVNVFSIESFMDELATAAKADPVEFRLRHLQDSRARDVITTAAERFGWSRYQRSANRGRGFAFARYKNSAAYCAVALEVEVQRDTGRVRVTRAVSAVDSGEVVNPDGIRNQIEGGILQSVSWTLYEAVTFNASRITSVDWSTYPILRFDAVPDSLEVHILPRPGQPFLGTGEASQGPAAAALANAFADATSKRLRDIPFTRERVRAVIAT